MKKLIEGHDYIAIEDDSLHKPIEYSPEEIKKAQEEYKKLHGLLPDGLAAE